MSFKPIPVERKIEVIYRVVKGEKIQPIAREAGVDRASIYLWKERALSALREALEPRKRGPKFKKSPKDREIEKLREKLSKIESLLKEKEEQARELKEELNPSGEKTESVRCPYCGFEKVYKNGTYKRKLKGFFDKLKQDKQKKERVQGFLCPWCGKSFHVEKKGVSSALT
ncbi:MAG: helix-turn-helix domain-containing protein [Candidatus Aerophobetes bacterium]|nr:helix-turn-helix domain-containing protein [Candidatus Aerophobetes bacterium]